MHLTCASCECPLSELDKDLFGECYDKCIKELLEKKFITEETKEIKSGLGKIYYNSLLRNPPKFSLRSIDKV